ncbi:hypothetical protein [Phreatobacter stygius]|uniref:Flagellin C-terminal domain-containing protein n=1 Tax=Phreatobacter stygius TaxID=1940610 RepID=A0A4D7ATY5_9HYPH|nr:hypothetical protein [Phreatobacter stygius]QCI63021.1 hypothetical protein E8M01_01450 [Phreatobacter stygius]
MAIRTSGIIPGFGGTDFLQMKNQLAELQRQLGSGKKSETYAGLGLDRSLALSFQGSRSQVASYQQNISLVQTRIKIMDTALSGVQKTVASTKTSLTSIDFTLASGRTVGQLAASNSLDAVIGMLNSDDGGRYLFGGRQTGTPPVLDSAAIMAGQGTKDGFKQALLERMQADLGSSAASPERDAGATGRLTLSGAAASPITLAEDGAHAFGLKLDNVTGAVGGATATMTAGPPASLSIATGAGTAKAGENLTIGFKLPDGSTERITLTAVAADSPTVGPGQFRIGATQTETLANMRGALGDGLAKLVSTGLAAASATEAGEDFFKGETNAAVLAGPPAVQPGVAKRLVPGVSGTMADAVAFDTPANAENRTLRWYQGDRISGDPRATAAAQVDTAVSVTYGARADEEALRATIQNLAVASAVTFQNDDTLAKERYQALASRVASGLSGQGAAQTVTSIQIEIASANSNADAAKARHKETDAMLTGLLSDVTGVNNEELAAQIVALQTMMQASYQTSSMLSKLTLVNYL